MTSSYVSCIFAALALLSPPFIAIFGQQLTSPMIVVNTWPITSATDAAWNVLTGAEQDLAGTAVDAVVAGCSVAEDDQTVRSVGYGCSPDEQGHTTLDAMVMDGRTMEVGAVGALPNIRQAAQVARAVMQSTRHTLLVGPAAAEFAMSRGFMSTPLETPQSQALWRQWKDAKCQPNFRRPEAWDPDPSSNCGPYTPKAVPQLWPLPESRPKDLVNADRHDTIGVIAIDSYGSMAVAVSTSGAHYKIPGRVGDSPIPGAGGYVDNEVGAAVATGDGDIMMRFLLTYRTVDLMRQGLDPTKACEQSLSTVKQVGKWSGAIVALNRDGVYGAACVGFPDFKMCLRSTWTDNTTRILTIPCMNQIF